MTQAKFNLICTILLTLSTIFWAESGLGNFDMAIAQTTLVPAPSLQEPQPEAILTKSEEVPSSHGGERLTNNQADFPSEVQSAVLEDTARRTSKPVGALRIIEAQSQNWSNGCLEIAEPDVACAQVITPGWQVVVTDGQRNWTYRTDSTGELVKLEKSP